MKKTFTAVKKPFGMIWSLGLGALLTYMFDPQAGRRRRAAVRDKMIRFGHKTRDAIDVTSRDLKNRAIGVTAEMRKLTSKEEVTGESLAQRVRSHVVSIVSHPRSIDVQANNGKIILSGPILAAEVDRLISYVSSMPGVTEVENRLEIHEQPGNVPGLQGQPAVRKSGQVLDVMQANWSPTTRFIAGTFGASLALYGARQLNALGTAVATLGTAILTRALTNMEFRRLTGIGAGCEAVTVHKIINITAPVEEVFAFWSNYENFPRFMSNVRDVKDIGEKQSRWTVAGPAGTSVQWNATVINYVPNELLAWKTMPDSAVQHAGIVRFSPNPDGTTRVDIRMSYNPAAGALGHAVASLFGADAKSEIEQDLVRMKTMIETGRLPHDAARRDETAHIN
jgi:uncharacterized membrane protein